MSGGNVISLAGFLAYIRAPVNIPAVVLPDTDWSIPTAYHMARETVNTQLRAISGHIYRHAVYNLGVDILINIAQDQPNRDELRKKREDYKIAGFVPGVISSSSNAGTAESLFNAEVFKGFLLGDLQNLKTPWGRQYLAVAMQIGSNWGMS